MKRFRLGRRAAVRNDRTRKLQFAMGKALDALGTPPAVSADYVSAVIAQAPSGWGMMLNDQIGDCVPADTGHELMLRSANTGTIVIPTDAQIEQLYEAVGGYDPNAALVNGQNPTDQGCDEAAMCQYLMTTGFCDVQSAGTGPIDQTNLDHIRWAVQLFGACRLGIIVGEDFEQQFQSQQPWTAPTTDPNAGGHDVPVVKYDDDYAYVVTWGGGGWPQGLQPVAWSLMANAQFIEEAHGDVWPDWIAASGNAPSGFPLTALLHDLATIEQVSGNTVAARGARQAAVKYARRPR